MALCLHVINGALQFFFSVSGASRLKQQTPTVGKTVVAISISLFDCSQTLAQAARRGRAVNSGISGGHLHTCECLNRSALDTGGAQRTIQLCKHAATSFPGLLQACTETSHCLNSTHSIPVPGPHPAAASSLQACLPACLSRDRHRLYHQQGSSTTNKGLL